MAPNDVSHLTIVDHTLDLCRLAKDARLSVTQGRLIDVFRSLKTIDLLNVDDYRLALRSNLVSTREEETRFDKIFQDYWYGADRKNEDYKPWKPELIRDEKQHGEINNHAEMFAKQKEFSSEEMFRELNLTERWSQTAPSLDQVIRALAKRLATRPSRRRQNVPKGHAINLRNSIRRNLRHGMEVLDLARVKRRTRKTRIVLLSDVSGSMDAFNPFLLQLMFGLQKELKSSRTFVFSTELTEITSSLRRNSVQKALRDVATVVQHWSGGTNIGHSLAKLNRGILREGSSRSTVAIIISDGYDSGRAELIEQEMQVMRRRVRKIVWINPMYGATTFEVRATGMKAALPFVDHFLPAFNAKSLEILVRALSQI